MLSSRFGKLGKLGKVNPTYTYARARDMGLTGVYEKMKNLILIAITFPSFPSFPQKKKTGLETRGYRVAVCRVLLPMIGCLLPLLPTTIQHLAESSK